MIVWLASYPRSGSKLIRTVLKQTLSMDSYSEETPAEQQISAISDVADLIRYREILGFREKETSWDDFYHQATNAPSPILVKTHRLPKDSQPAIYIVRDGRLALQSYMAFHRNYHPETGKRLFDLICGDDEYGDWSSHFNSWSGRSNGNFLLVRFEELVESSENLLHRIAAFIKHPGPIEKWQNPFEALKKLNPRQYGHGSPQWHANEAWSAEAMWLFWTMHGRLMVRLGYATQETVRQQTEEIPSGLTKQLLAHTLRLVRKKKELTRMSEEKEAVIQELKYECDRRLGLLQK